MSTPDPPDCSTSCCESPRPPSQRILEKDKSRFFEVNRRLDILQAHNTELAGRVAELECSMGRIGVAFHHLSTLNSVLQGSTIYNNGNTGGGGHRDGGDRRSHYHSSGNPNFQDQRREFSPMGDPPVRFSSRGGNSFGGGRGRGRKG